MEGYTCLAPSCHLLASNAEAEAGGGGGGGVLLSVLTSGASDLKLHTPAKASFFTSAREVS